MKTVTLYIKREKAMVGAAMPYRIIYDGKELGKITIGKEISCEISNSQSTLEVSMVGNSLTIHKIKKEVVLFPQYCKTGVINCTIYSKMNWLGFLTFGLFQAVGRLEVTVEYL